MKFINKLILFFVILLLSIACVSTNSEPVSEPDTEQASDSADQITSDAVIPSTQAEELHGSLQYYFTSPGPGSDCEISSILIKEIEQAEQSIDAAIYNINLQDVAVALIQAHKRGVTVRIVLENNRKDNAIPGIIADSGIPMVYDPDQSTMHNKFMVIDRRTVWTGSMNFTDSGCTDDYNNMVRVESDKIADNYATEFAEMFEDHSFSAASPANTPYRQVEVGYVIVENYFSPDDGVRDTLIDLIDQADHSIVFMAFAFTSDELANAIVERYEAGIEVHGIMDAEQIQSNTGGEYEFLLKNGIDVRQDDIYGQMHNKVIIIDEEIVITGSYNFSGNAEYRNDENVLIIHSPEAARQYLKVYEMIETE